VRASIERLGDGFVRAGPWLFGTGLRAQNGGVLFERMHAALSAAGSSMSRVARLDQYYPDASFVPAYHEARKLAFGEGHIAPSTSVIVSGLLAAEAQMDVQVIVSQYVPHAVQSGLNRPDASGYTPCVRVGDLIFVAGQLARDGSGKLAARGTAAETEYMVRERFAPALAAAQSGLELILKAQAYISQPHQVGDFWRAWSAAFPGGVPPTTVVPLRHPAFLTSEATVEINIIAAHRSARERIRAIAGAAPARMLDGLLFFAGLSGASVEDVMERTRHTFAAAGSDPANIVRMIAFSQDLATLPTPGIAFTAVKAPTELIVDLWGYAPPS
jgi:enamine deaminase RidA (YjgF/YER057c/UK114 family)